MATPQAKAAATRNEIAWRAKASSTLADLADKTNCTAACES
jgi:hypothetical protein